MKTSQLVRETWTRKQPGVCKTVGGVTFSDPLNEFLQQSEKLQPLLRAIWDLVEQNAAALDVTFRELQLYPGQRFALFVPMVDRQTVGGIWDGALVSKSKNDTCYAQGKTAPVLRKVLARAKELGIDCSAINAELNKLGFESL